MTDTLFQQPVPVAEGPNPLAGRPCEPCCVTPCGTAEDATEERYSQIVEGVGARFAPGLKPRPSGARHNTFSATSEAVPCRSVIVAVTIARCAGTWNLQIEALLFSG